MTSLGLRLCWSILEYFLWNCSFGLVYSSFVNLSFQNINWVAQSSGSISKYGKEQYLWKHDIWLTSAFHTYIPRKFKRDWSPSHCLRSKKPPLTLKPAALRPKFKFFSCEKSDVSRYMNEITTRYPLIALISHKPFRTRAWNIKTNYHELIEAVKQ